MRRRQIYAERAAQARAARDEANKPPEKPKKRRGRPPKKKVSNDG